MLPNYVANHALFWSNFMSRITLSWWHISTLKKVVGDTNFFLRGLLAKRCKLKNSSKNTAKSIVLKVQKSDAPKNKSQLASRGVPRPPGTRPLKKVLFDTTGFLGAQNLTQEQRDSRQNLYDNRSKEQCFEAICEHITAV